MDFETWLNELIRPESRKKASNKAGYAQSTLSRQLEKGRLSPEMVIALCRAYGRNPVTGLVETGYINDYETDGVGINYELSKATNQQILDEIVRRSDPEARVLFGGDGYDNVLDLPEKQNSGTPLDEKPEEAIDHDEIIRQINAGEIQVAAQKATEPLEEHFT